MKHIVLVLLLIVHSVQLEMTYPPSFPQLKDSESSIQMAQEAFSVVCGHTWKILTAINMPSKAYFPGELFALIYNPEFKITVNCSTDRKSMNVTFLAPRCEQMYESLAENPIVFQIEQKRPNSSEVHFQLISPCIQKSNDSLIDTANIGHDNEKTWYLVHRSIMDIAKNVRFGLIVFGKYEKFKGKNDQRSLNSAFSHVGETLFSNQLKNILPNKRFKSGCALFQCYYLNPNRSSNTHKNDGKKEKLVFLLILVIIGVFLLGMIIFCST